MHRATLRRIASPFAALLLASLLLACSSDESAAPDSSMATAAVTPSSTPRQTPTPITTTATPFPAPPPLLRPLVPEPPTPELASILDSGDTLVVVSGEVRSNHSQSRSWPTIAVVTLDSTGDEQARLKFGGVGNFPHSWKLVDDEVIVGFENAIVRYRLDGTIATVLRPESELGYQSLLLSPDGSRIAFAEFGDPDCGVACIVFADAATGEELGRTAQVGTALSELSHVPLPFAWRGNDAMLVRGTPNGHAASGLATLWLDSHIEIHPTDPNGTVSPNGNRILRLSGMIDPYDEPLSGCGFATSIDVHAISSSEVVASSHSATAGVSDVRWSPDGASLLFQRKLLPDADEVPCEKAYSVWFQNPSEWSLLNVATGSESSNVTPDDILSSWFGNRWADLICPAGAPQGTLYATDSRSTRCLDSNDQLLLETTVRLVGTPIATGPWDRVLGVLPPSTQLTPEELHALPPDTRFGEPEVDAIIDAALAANADALMDAIDWQQLPCATDWTGGFPSPPPCAVDEADGTPVESLPLGGGELQNARPDTVRSFLDRELPRNRALCEIQTHDAGRRVVRFRLATVYRGQPTSAVTDDLTFTIIDGHITSVGNLVDPVHRDSVRCPGIRNFSPN